MTKKQLKAERDELRAALESVGTALKLSEASLSIAREELNNTLFNQSRVLETMQFNLNSFNLTNEFNSGLNSVKRFESTSFASFIFFPLFSFLLLFLGFFYLIKKKKNQKGSGDLNEMYLKDIVKKQEI
jgi:ATP-dependent Zn protease